MRQIATSVVIESPVAVVFSFVAEAANSNRWASGGPQFEKVTDGPIGVGTVYRYRGTFMGRRVHGTRTYSAYEPNRLIAHENTGLGPVPVKEQFFFETVAGGTKVGLITEWGRLPGVWPLLEPFIAAFLRRMTPGELARLKHAVEALPNGA